MANLIIDIGNSYTKAAVIHNGAFVKQEHLEKPDFGQIKTITACCQINNTVISSVKKEAQDWESQLNEVAPVTRFNRENARLINNRHDISPQTGADRLAGVMGAASLFPGQNCLVIDGGTCITYDLIDAGGNYRGGSISPGLNMRFKAMNHYTSALPLVQAGDYSDNQIGIDTESAMRSGVQNGLKYELEGFIKEYNEQHCLQHIILTGGDGNFFDSLLKSSIFAPYIIIERNLVLQGLNAVIDQH